ncbi:MAG TPA: lysophospholipid acyltransferase family protein [Candidatus Limnocylindrales bacterium]|nr:lysophospholipid acyltransferase family protein [Candidatus Limnocylindrales bacterium]
MANASGPEGLAYLNGRRPTPRAGLLLRLIAALGRFAGRRIAGLRWSVEGLEHLPPGGGHIVACAIHRSWIDAPLLVAVLPLEPRVWYIGSGVAAFRSRWTAWLLRAIGGILPVYRGGTDIDVHVDAARAVLDGGAVFGIFPEGSRKGDPLRSEPFRRGIGLIGLRTGAPIVPVALAGTAELYRGRRIAFRILPPTTALELAGMGAAPAAGSAAEMAAARAATVSLEARLATHVAALAAACDDPPEAPRRWRWLTTLVR